MDNLSLQAAIAQLKSEFEAHNHDGTSSRAFDSVRVLSHLSAPAGYIGGVNNGIKIDSGGLTIVGSGVIRTKDSGPRIELVRSVTGGYTSALMGYSATGLQFFRLFADGGLTYLFMQSAGGCASFSDSDSNGTNTVNIVTIASQGSNYGLKLEPSGASGGLHIANVAASTGAMIRLDPASVNADLVTADEDTTNGIKQARVNALKYIQFPAYYHCSDFDENIVGNTEISASVIAKAYWSTSGAGTKQMIPGGNEDKNHYVRLATTTTSGRMSQIMFGRYMPYLHTAIEARMIMTPITSATVYFGMRYDNDNFIRFKFDSAKDATKLYREAKNAGTVTSAQTLQNMANQTWITLRIQNLSNSKVQFFVNDVDAGEITTNIPTGASLKPYVYVDNKTSAADKWLMVDYVKIWANRNDTISYQ